MCRPRRPLTAVRAALACLALIFPGLQGTAAAVSPSQVLVLYNADWQGDEPLTDPGQDSREVAEHYVAMHTDLATGEKPHLIGLRCVHRKGHLEGAHLSEDSHDNASGVVLRTGGKIVGPAGGARDSRAVEFVLPGGAGAWRFETLRLELKPARGDAVRVVEGGKGVLPGASVQESGPWNVRWNARAAVVGPVVARAACEDQKGKTQHWQAEYQDYLDVECSRTGADGVRDDRNFLDDVERPVKTYLEDPRNARPDGTLLKDHVLFFVVCYGLPKTAAATYGIARGVTDRLGDHGVSIDLGQRLQLLHYDVEGALGFVPKAHRFTGAKGFTEYLFRAPQAWSLWGERANPFVHPLAYDRKKGPLEKLPEPVAFTVQGRRRFPGRHLYFAMRIDAGDPLAARGLVDRAVYASTYGPPSRPPGAERDKEGTTALGRLVSSRGYWLGSKRQRAEKPTFLRLAPSQGFFNEGDSFFPGGIAARVISSNGWNIPGAEVHKFLGQGVTVTAGAARVGGAPHIHDKSWWDDEILYPFLLRGRTIGECLLMNQEHLAWVTSFVGDPLYRLPEGAGPGREPPAVGPEGVRLVKSAGRDATKRVLVAVDLSGTAARPQVAQMRVWPPGQGVASASANYDARPCVAVETPSPLGDGPWRIELVDPAGQRTVWSGKIEMRQ